MRCKRGTVFPTALSTSFPPCRSGRFAGWTATAWTATASKKPWVSTRTWRVRFRWKLRIRQVTGDTKYGTIPNIRAVEDMGIRAYVPLPDWEHNSAYFGASKFTYDAEHDHYVCPNGQALRHTHTSEAGQRIQYRAQASTCRACPLRGCYEPPINLSSLGSKRQTKAAKWRPARVAGRRS
jgi:hypothetical protein